MSISAGNRVMLLYGSANRDPRRWAEPDRFDITRSARGHLAFEHGIHVCPGAHLARLEAIAVLTALARRADRLELAAPPTRQVNNTVRGFTHTPHQGAPRVIASRHTASGHAQALAGRGVETARLAHLVAGE